MSKEYRATPDQWAYQEHYAVEDGDAACLLELRSRLKALEARIAAAEGKYETCRLAALEWGRDVDTHGRLIDKLWHRVEALEAAQRVIRSGPESPLVERVADAIAAQATSAGIVNDRPARAAILEVGAWLAEQSITITGQAWAEQLRTEAEG